MDIHFEMWSEKIGKNPHDIEKLKPSQNSHTQNKTKNKKTNGKTLIF